MSDTLPDRLRDEADQCRNDGANDIAKLLDEAASALAARQQAQVPEGVWVATVEVVDGEPVDYETVPGFSLPDGDHRLFAAAPQAAQPQGEEARNAERYRKLRGWMSSNVQAGWQEVENLASVACYVSWEAFDRHLDALPECRHGLMALGPDSAAAPQAAQPEQGDSNA